MSTQHYVQETKAGDFIVRSPRHGREVFRTSDRAAADQRARHETHQLESTDALNAARFELRENIIRSIAPVLPTVYSWQDWRNDLFSAMSRIASHIAAQERADKIQESTQREAARLSAIYSEAVVLDTAFKNGLYDSNIVALTALAACNAFAEAHAHVIN